MGSDKLIVRRGSQGGRAAIQNLRTHHDVRRFVFGLIYEQGSGVGGWSCLFFRVYPWPKMGWAKFVWRSAMLSGARDLCARALRHRAPGSRCPVRFLSKALVERVSSDRLTRFGWVS